MALRSVSLVSILTPHQKTDPHVVRRKLLISGVVQGVGFRWACRQAAKDAGIAIWAHNLPDGRVEVLLEGPANAVADVEEWCHTGPRHAVVAQVEGKDEPINDLRAKDQEPQHK